MDNVDFKLPWKLPKQKTLIETNINTKKQKQKTRMHEIYCTLQCIQGEMLFPIFTKCLLSPIIIYQSLPVHSQFMQVVQQIFENFSKNLGYDVV